MPIQRPMWRSPAHRLVPAAFRRGRMLAAAPVQLQELEPAPVVCMVCGRDELGAARPVIAAVASGAAGTSFTHTVCAGCLAELERSPAV